MNVTIRRLSGPKVDTRLVRLLARDTLQCLGATADELSIVLVDDPTIARLNRQFHQAAGPTDVLSFDYTTGSPDEAATTGRPRARRSGPPAAPVNGELVISAERALAQAPRFRSTPAREVALYLVHGILHLHGYDDRTSAQRRRMRQAERRLLARFTRTHPLFRL